MERRIDRIALADLVFAKLEKCEHEMRESYLATKNTIGMFFVDDLLPEPIARDLHANFPDPAGMKLKKSLREHKYIAAQMNQYAPILEEALYAFQDPRIVSLIGRVCEIGDLFPDEHLYAGGISLMGFEHFLNPHLDNSHDKDRNRWRVLNLLYYVTPDWQLDFGGNLELWPEGLEGRQTTIHSKFNRLAVMATHDASWHSVSPVVFRGNRCCVSNYYFSNNSLRTSDQFHVTSFRGRPEQRFRDAVLRADGTLRMLIRKFFRTGIVENKHVYKK